MKNLYLGTGRDFQGPRPEKIRTSHVWGLRVSLCPSGSPSVAPQGALGVQPNPTVEAHAKKHPACLK
eukprot:7963350-Pyramimonas_sp.AAC.1